MTFRILRIFTLVLVIFLSGCASNPLQEQTKSNVSEQIILAALGRSSETKNGLGLFKSSSCVFNKGDNRQNFTELLGQSAPLNPQQTEEAFNLLVSGKVVDQTKRAIDELLGRIADSPKELLSDTASIFRDPLDLRKLPGIKTAGQTAKIFVDPDKRAFNLAILAYARMNGINLEEQNLTDLYQYLENGQEADFNRLVNNGLETLKKQYGVNDIEQAAAQFHSSSQGCLTKAK